MKNIIKGSSIIFSAIVEFNKDVINFSDIFMYEKILKKKLENTSYIFESIDEERIYKFCKMFQGFVHVKNKSQLVLTDNINIRNKMINAFNKDLPNDLKPLLKMEKILIFPVIADDEILNYKFLINDTMVEELIKTKFNFKKNENGEYIVDLEKVENNFEDTELFLNSVFYNSTKILSNVFNRKTIEEFLRINEEIFSFKYKNISDYFKMDKSIEEVRSNYIELYKYYNLAKMNNEKLKKYNILINNDKKSKQLVR